VQSPKLPIPKDGPEFVSRACTRKKAAISANSHVPNQSNKSQVNYGAIKKRKSELFIVRPNLPTVDYLAEK
jgi:hypothetical protein